eukprot:gene44833-30498_t
MHLSLTPPQLAGRYGEFRTAVTASLMIPSSDVIVDQLSASAVLRDEFGMTHVAAATLRPTAAPTYAAPTASPCDTPPVRRTAGVELCGAPD